MKLVFNGLFLYFEFSSLIHIFPLVNISTQKEKNQKEINNKKIDNPTTAASVHPDYHILNGTSVRPQSSKRYMTSAKADAISTLPKEWFRPARVSLRFTAPSSGGFFLIEKIKTIPIVKYIKYHIYLLYTTMIELMKYTYLMEPEKIQAELDKYRKRYEEIINQENSTRVEMNEARAILFLTGQLYCEQIAVGAIERRLHLLPGKPTLVEFFLLIDSESELLEDYRRHHLFNKLEQFYRIIKTYKNKHLGGKYYLEEEKFLKKYNEMSPNPEMRIGYKGDFNQTTETTGKK